MPPIWIHVGLPVVAILVTFPLWNGFHPKGIMAAAIVIAGIIVSLLAHELGHAFMARRCGLAPVLIRLHAGGGEAISEGEGRTPRQDRLITLAGPAVNLAIGLACIAAFAILAADPPPPLQSDPASLWSRPPPTVMSPLFRALEWLGWLNLIWAAVNLLPAFPLDGGHLLYSVIEERSGSQRALFWTGTFGMIFAVIAKVVFIGGLLTGMVIWSPPYLAPNWQALKAARRPRATIVRLRKS
ncbi:M50 family metallopeptidase [Rhizobium hidalgonense]|uniref:M50 family metallopeptidase n=1 Tax=Rhizobium hidalgonense TaxID=1538159 RepID=UPI002870D591|nr:site-2 protease family protein [Rhizobium hidalgonense]MDR9804682.1 site-2 protease family protein [Rhizobium hidalgonense]